MPISLTVMIAFSLVIGFGLIYVYKRISRGQ